MMGMKTPCEEMFKEILPAIRALIVKDLVERHHLNQVEVAERLGITQPAVSQYLRSLRGTSRVRALRKRSDFMKSLRKLSDAVAAGKMRGVQIAKEYCNLCAMLRKKRATFE
jgi:predicted transcriptional regulator